MEEGLGQLIAQFLSSAWSDAVVWFGGLWAVLLFIRKVFKDADDELDPEKRQSLAEDLARNKNWAAGSWIPDFTLVFDRFFGKKHFRWRCIYRSTLISIVTYSVLVLLTGEMFASEDGELLCDLAGLALIVVFCNAFADYFSLLETRILLNTRLPTSLKILLDVFLTFVVIFGWMSFAIWVVYNVILGEWQYDYMSSWEAVQTIWETLYEYDDPESRLFRIVVATSFTTSVWLWLHGLAQLTIRALSAAGFLMGWLNVKERPVRAIGTTINIFVLSFGVVLYFPFAFAR